MTNTNITVADSAVVIDQRMWAGSDPSSTAWLQTPIGSNSAAGALNLLVVDIKIAAASQPTVLDLADQDAATKIAGIEGAAVVSVLSVVNNSGGFEIPADIHTTGGKVLFTSPAGTDTDVMRVTLLYN